MKTTFLWLVLVGLDASGGTTLKTWVRGSPGVTTLDLAKQPPTEAAGADAQYGAPHTYRGVRLDALIAQAGPDKKLDLLVLHFQNGMAVPLPFRDSAVMKKLDPLVALSLKTSSALGDELWTNSFPPLRKKGAESRDRRPIEFDGNKLVVRSLFHPLLPASAADDSSPWRHVDTLVGLEFAVSTAWSAQFAATNAVKDGERLFLSRCQFCHGVKKVGASMGWDFVDPISVARHRSPTSLWLHVKSREGDAPEKGYLMPAFRDVTESDAAAIWRWMEAIGKTGPKAYAP